MKTAKALYLFELKLNMSAQAAIKQIDLKDYSSKFALSGLPIVKVGINFDPERRTICDWKVESWKLKIEGADLDVEHIALGVNEFVGGIAGDMEILS